MKFGRRLQEEAFEEFQPHYISYKELKKAIKVITGSDTSQYTISEVTSNFGNIRALAGSSYRPPESRFQDLLNFEVEKINKFSALIYSSISSNLQTALKSLYHGDIATLENLKLLREAAETSADGVAYLHSYSKLNFIGFRKITKKYDKHNKSAASGFYLARLVKEPFINLNFDFLVELISIVFGEMRRVKRALVHSSKKSETVNGAESDEESGYEEDDVDLDDYDSLMESKPSNGPLQMTNTTYLVGESDIMRVRVHLAKHIPLISLGTIMCPRLSKEIVKAFVTGIPVHHQQGSTCVTIERPSEAKPLPRCAKVDSNLMLDSSGNFVNPAMYRFERSRVSAGCLYFDNNELDIYRSLILPQVDEGKAEVLRLRWLPEPQQLNGDFRGLATVLLEFVKAFQVAESPNEWQDIPVTSDGNHYIPDSVILKRSQIPEFFNGQLSIQSVINDMKLPPLRVPQIRSILERACYLIKEKRCTPLFQEWMHRTKFRKSGSNVTHPVFAHLDESIRFTDAEKQLERDNGFSFWIAPHLSPFIMDRDVHVCPYGVLTISLAGNTKPKFLPKIIGLTTVSEVWRYAPQLHGVPLFKRAQLGSSDLPHWFQFVAADVEENKEVKSVIGKKEAKGQTGVTSVDGTNNLVDNTMRVDIVSLNPGARLLHEHAVTIQQQQQENVANDDRRLSASASRQLSMTPRGLSSLNEPLLMGVNAPISPEALDQSLNYHRITPPRSGSSARTLLGISPSEQPPQEGFVTRLYSFIPRLPEWFNLSGDSSRSGLVGTAAVRVEPKTFFANERTLLQWMNTAVLLSTISITLLNFGTPTGRLAGLIMAPVALFFLIYSFLVYLRRSYSLEMKVPINYNDRLGPAVLVFSLICALSAIIVLNIVYGPAGEFVPSSNDHSNIDAPMTDASKTASYGANIPMPHPTSSDFLAITQDVQI